MAQSLTCRLATTTDDPQPDKRTYSKRLPKVISIRMSQEEKYQRKLAAQKARYHRLPEIEKEKAKLQMRARKHGITVDLLLDLEKKQDGKCAICGSTKSEHGRSEKLYFDHCHKTNRPRALLCHQCNILIGSAKDSIQILEQAITFLKKHQ
jgi:hypothetical protein